MPVRTAAEARVRGEVWAGIMNVSVTSVQRDLEVTAVSEPPRE